MKTCVFNLCISIAILVADCFEGFRDEDQNGSATAHTGDFSTQPTEQEAQAARGELFSRVLFLKIVKDEKPFKCSLIVIMLWKK